MHSMCEQTWHHTLLTATRALKPYAVHGRDHESGGQSGGGGAAAEWEGLLTFGSCHQQIAETSGVYELQDAVDQKRIPMHFDIDHQPISVKCDTVASDVNAVHATCPDQRYESSLNSSQSAAWHLGHAEPGSGPHEKPSSQWPAPCRESTH
jgi:hypothetical protein